MAMVVMLMVVMMNLEAKPHSSLLHLLLLDGVDLAVQPGQQGGDRVKGEGEREAIGAWVEQGGEEGGVKGEQDGGGGQPAALAHLLVLLVLLALLVLLVQGGDDHQVPLTPGQAQHSIRLYFCHCHLISQLSNNKLSAKQQYGDSSCVRSNAKWRQKDFAPK